MHAEMLQFSLDDDQWEQDWAVILSIASQPGQCQSLSGVKLKVKVKERIAVNGTPSHSYRVSLAVWDHTVLPATRHK